MSRRRIGSVEVIVALSVACIVGLAPRLVAQCRPPLNSNDARLLAYYEVPITFSMAGLPTRLPAGGVTLTGEVVGVPAARSSLVPDYCYSAKQERSHLAPVLPRLRLTVGLPAGFALEGSYLPPVTVDQAQPNLGSLALSYTRVLFAPPATAPGAIVTFEARLHGTLGSVTGAITCPSGALQTTSPAAPCYGTKPSSDTFHPTSGGAEATVGASTRGGLGAFVGTGYTHLDPHFRVGFTDLNGATDRTLVEVELNRAEVFGGVQARIIGPLDAAAEIYSVPADLTTWRLSVRYRLP